MGKRSAQRHRQERREQEGERRLAAMEVKALDAVQEIVERKVGQDESRQPRFSTPASIFSSIYRWALTCMANEPSIRAPFKTWDEWYRDFAKREPFLVGVLNSAVAIDKNRGWTLTGGKNQVAKYTKRFHGFDNGAGWRSYIDWQAQSYYTTRMGFVSETGREGKAGPLITMWSVDPCRCELSGDPKKPLWYIPRSGGKQEWTPDMFVRGKSLVSTDETQATYGYPAVARCYDLAKIMVGIYSHYQQKVGTKTPDGILTGKFISPDQWETAVQARTEALQADPSSYLNSLATIMSSGGDMPEFALTLLSSIPDRWDFDAWTLVLMRGYALSFGYQSSEFYPEPAGVMGRGKEQEEQRRSATGKGGKDFALAYQEQLQQPGILPPTLEFQFEERDVTGEQADAALNLAKAQVMTEVTKWVINGQSVLTTEQVMELAAEQGIIPEDWTPQQEDVTTTDEESADTESERIYRACQAFPDEPIVRYSWPSNKTRVLYRYGADRFAPKFIIRTPWYSDPKVVRRFDPAQPRDEEGKWTDTGGGASLFDAELKKAESAIAESDKLFQDTDFSRKIRQRVNDYRKEFEGARDYLDKNPQDARREAEALHQYLKDNLPIYALDRAGIKLTTEERWRKLNDAFRAYQWSDDYGDQIENGARAITGLEQDKYNSHLSSENNRRYAADLVHGIAMTKPRDIVAFRGAYSGGNLEIGQGFESALLAFSHNEKSATVGEFAGGVVFRLHKSSRGLSASRDLGGTGWKFEHEDEYLTGGKFKVVGKQQRGKFVYIDIEQIAPPTIKE